MNDAIAKLMNSANKHIQAGRWIATYGNNLIFHEENGIPVPETFLSREAAVTWMENELEKNMLIFKDRGIDRYQIIEKNMANGQPTYLLFEARVRGIKVCLALEKVTPENLPAVKKRYYQEAKQNMNRWHGI